MVEIVVVLLIIAVLGSVMVMTMRSSKKTSYFKVGTAAAASYANAVEAYMADNGQVPPQIGTTAWPAQRKLRVLGPRDVMLKGPPGTNGKPYIARGIPEPVLDGLVDFGTNSATRLPGAQVYITYRVQPSTNSYQLLVETVMRGDSPADAQRCVVTNATTTPTGIPRCS